MDAELHDYPGSGANNRHTPKPQYGRCADCWLVVLYIYVEMVLISVIYCSVMCLITYGSFFFLINYLG